MSFTPALSVYRFVAARVDPIAQRRIRRRISETDDLSGRQNERLGQPGRRRPDGELLWIHTRSPSALVSASDLIVRLRAARDDDLNVLVTTGGSAAAVSDTSLGPDTVHQLAPLDTLNAVRRFLAHWAPDAGLFLGPELRPTLLLEARENGIPLFMADARIPETVARRMRWMPLSRRALAGCFRRFVAGTATDQQGLRRFGVPDDKVEVLGYLEEGTGALGCDEIERDALATMLGGRPVWLAASVELDEVDIVIAAHEKASKLSHRLLLILVPNDAENAAALAQRLEAAGWATALRSEGEDPSPGTQVFIADCEGEMGLWYRLAPITFVGSSLVEPGGGHNPYEAAALGSAVLYGPNIRPQRTRFNRLASAGAARLVLNADTLGATVTTLLAPDKAAQMAHAAWSITSSGAEVTDRIVELIINALDEKERGNARP